MDMSLIDAMFAELETAAPAYQPTNIWTKVIPLHLMMLRDVGFENFKRSLNRHYAQDDVVDYGSDLVQSLAAHLNATALRHLAHMDLSGGIQVFAEESHAHAFATYVGLLWDACEDMDPEGLRRRLAEPALGNPLYLDYDGQTITQDLAKSAIDILAISKLFPEVRQTPALVAEIGPGYGRLAHAFSQVSDCRWVFFDIAPTLAVAQTYFETLFPGQVAGFARHKTGQDVSRAMAGKRFAFFTPNQIELFPDQAFDLTLNIDSFGEMRAESARTYVAQASRVTRSGGGLYFRNLSEAVSSKLAVENFAVPRRADYQPAGSWTLLEERLWPLDPRYVELAWRRS